MSDRKEFIEFIQNENTSKNLLQTREVWSHLEAKIETRLFPKWQNLTLKILGLHVLGSALSLALCPQFGFHLWGTSHGLMGYFMSAGTWGCQILCGGFYVSFTILLLNLFLTSEEFRLLAQKSWAVASAGVLFSLAFFWMVSPNVFSGLTIIWCLGALIMWLLPMRFRRSHFSKTLPS